MAVLQAETKRGILRSLWRSAKSKAVSLAEALAAFQDQGFPAIRNGRPVVATSGAGHSVSFQISSPQNSEITQVQIFNLSEELLATYDEARATLVSAGTATPTDDAIFAGMLAADALQTVTFTQKDHLMTRWAAR